MPRASRMAEQTAGAWQQAPMQAENPMAIHVKVIAILFLVFGGFAAIGALLVLGSFLVGAGIFAEGDAGGFAGFLAALGIFLFVVVAAFAVLYLVAGMLLLKHRRSGKGWGIAAAVPSLLSFPIGTAVGVYALVILTRPDTERLLVNA
jgi:hypothetical protein